MRRMEAIPGELPTAFLDSLPNPVLVKNAALTYVWVNRAFEDLFGVSRDRIAGLRDEDIFPEQRAGANRDRRILTEGSVGEDLGTVIQERRGRRETLTRKSRLTLADGTVLLIGIMHDVTEVVTANLALAETSAALRAQAQELRRLADTDMLTGCLNRRALFELAGGVPSPTEVGLLLTDIDHFKSINDTYGHAAGDLALKHFATVVMRNIRETDTLARIGGEEFAVLLPGATIDATRVIAERIRAALAASPLVCEDGLVINMTVSIGVCLPESRELLDLDALLADADRRLYVAKREGRDRVVFAD
jgi:diguanylate cyclase (GGDEF)-like protein/PAS domain S-box-containing protein